MEVSDGEYEDRIMNARGKRGERRKSLGAPDLIGAVMEEVDAVKVHVLHVPSKTSAPHPHVQIG